MAPLSRTVTRARTISPQLVRLVRVCELEGSAEMARSQTPRTTWARSVVAQPGPGRFLPRVLFSSASAMSVESAAQEHGSSIRLSEQAVQRLRELQEETPEKPVYLRLMVEGGGCSGFQYEFSLDDDVRPGDRVYEQNGAKLVSDDLSLEFLRGSMVDFESDLMRSGFVVADNPNAASSCGCGSSFVAK